MKLIQKEYLGRNPLEEAVTLLQLEKFDAMKKEIRTLKQQVNSSRTFSMQFRGVIMIYCGKLEHP